MFKINWKKPDYKVIELEAENARAKDDLIEALKKQITILEEHIELLKWEKKVAEIPPTATEVTTRTKISTTTQLAKLLEEASLARKKDKENVKVS